MLVVMLAAGGVIELESRDVIAATNGADLGFDAELMQLFSRPCDASSGLLRVYWRGFRLARRRVLFPPLERRASQFSFKVFHGLGSSLIL